MIVEYKKINLDELTLKEFSSYQLDCHSYRCTKAVRLINQFCPHPIKIYHKRVSYDGNYYILIQHGEGEAVYYKDQNNDYDMLPYLNEILGWIRSVHQYEEIVARNLD